MLKKILVCSILILHSSMFASWAQSTHTGKIKQKLHKLNTLGTVLYIAAHPDDENTRLLSYFANERKYITAYLSLTRGDGGQNLIGNELGDGLGIIRTNELMAARSVDGAEQYFTRAVDFGYSKTPEESLEIWNHDSVLSDVVYIIRKLKPDIIITRFPSNGDGGHGHHTASALLAEEAFDLSNDSMVFPNHFSLAEVWQSHRLFWNVFRAKKEDLEGKDDVTFLDIGTYNRLLGISYGEMASESRSMHKSQGFGVSKQRGTQKDYLKLLKGKPFETDAFSDINTTWGRLQNGDKITSLINDVIKLFDEENPASIIPQLINIKKQIAQNINDEHWKKIKLKEVDELIYDCGGFFIEALNSAYQVSSGDSMALSVNFIHRSQEKIVLKKIHSTLLDTPVIVNTELNANEMMSKVFGAICKANVPFSNSYWLREAHNGSLFTNDDLSIRGDALNSDLPKCRIEFSINDMDFTLERNIQYKWVDPVRGELYRSLEVVAPIDIQPASNQIFIKQQDHKKIRITLQNKSSNNSGRLYLQQDLNFEITPEFYEYSFKEMDERKTFEFSIKANSISTNGFAHAFVRQGNQEYTTSISHIEYDHIPIQITQQAATIQLIKVDANMPPLQIGYIEGAGDKIPDVLTALGYNIKMITQENLSYADIKMFDVVITGIRAYNSNSKMAVYQPVLMEYVSKGGRMLVQYNTLNFLSNLITDLGPYPFSISRKRVTEEDALVLAIDSSSVLLNYPNKITPSDFEGWIQERGLYFADKYQNHYKTLFSMNDKNEDALEGSLIYTPYEKGMFIYTGLSFFRQLPAGNSGAINLFINLITPEKRKR